MTVHLLSSELTARELLELAEADMAALGEDEIASTLRSLDARRSDARRELELLEEAADRLERELARRGCGG
jgi:hypothetical protein